MSSACHIVRPKGRRLPIVVSCPHSGTEIPPDLARLMVPEFARTVPDTDWFVHELYSFAPELGITLLHAQYSRFVIDLNRDRAGKKLYADGRQETGLVPVRTFAAERLYTGNEPDQAEIERRVRVYYEPYHRQAAELIAELRQEHRHVLFYEAHSIKRHVPTVRAEPFPDMMLGDQRGKTAAQALTAAALGALKRQGGYSVAHNDPFMGGYLTRSFGKPETGVHALQLEMSQDIYMDETRAVRDRQKEAAVASVLKGALMDLAQAIEGLK